MEAGFWHQRWRTGEIGFHESKANPLLTGHLWRLQLPSAAKVFVPLCGKTLDIHWLLAKGYRVVGVELSELAVSQLFDELGLKPRIQASGELKRFSAENIEVFVGNLFDLSAEHLGEVAAIYDRGALVALPASMRRRYAAHLLSITAQAPQLLITYEYGQGDYQGPPFSISAPEINRHYAQVYQMNRVSDTLEPGELKGGVDARVCLWHLIGERVQSGLTSHSE